MIKHERYKGFGTWNSSNSTSWLFTRQRTLEQDESELLMRQRRLDRKIIFVRQYVGADMKFFLATNFPS